MVGENIFVVFLAVPRVVGENILGVFLAVPRVVGENILGVFLDSKRDLASKRDVDSKRDVNSKILIFLKRLSPERVLPSRTLDSKGDFGFEKGL